MTIQIEHLTVSRLNANKWHWMHTTVGRPQKHCRNQNLTIFYSTHTNDLMIRGGKSVGKMDHVKVSLGFKKIHLLPNVN